MPVYPGALRIADNTPSDEPILASLVITRFFDDYDFDVGIELN
jgi:hypothetical protein